VASASDDDDDDTPLDERRCSVDGVVTAAAAVVSAASAAVGELGGASMPDEVSDTFQLATEAAAVGRAADSADCQNSTRREGRPEEEDDE
jgi:hypothetical protein